MIEDFDIYVKKEEFSKYKNVHSTQIIGESDRRETFFTIIIPTYKRAETLEEALKSALSQVDFGDYEIVVVNNDPEGSLEEVCKLISKYQDRKINYFVNATNIGLCGNWNRCIELAKGKYIVMLHDDDILSPYCLKYLYRAINDNDNVGMVGVDYRSFSGVERPQFRECKKLKYRSVGIESFFFSKYINIAGMTFERELAINIGGFLEDYYPNEDTVFIFQALLEKKVINIMWPLAGYRQDINLSQNENTMKQIIILTERIRRCIADREAFARKWMRIFDKEYIINYIHGAKHYWKLQLDSREILKELGFEDTRINWIKYLCMLVCLKIKTLTL